MKYKLLYLKPDFMCI